MKNTYCGLRKDQLKLINFLLKLNFSKKYRFFVSLTTLLLIFFPDGSWLYKISLSISVINVVFVFMGYMANLIYKYISYAVKERK